MLREEMVGTDKAEEERDKCSGWKVENNGSIDQSAEYAWLTWADCAEP